MIFCSYRLSASGVFNLKSCRLIPKPVTRISVPSYQKLPCKLVHWVLQLLKYYLQWQIPKFMATVKVFTYRRCLKSLLSNSHKYSLLQSVSFAPKLAKRVFKLDSRLQSRFSFYLLDEHRFNSSTRGYDEPEGKGGSAIYNATP